MQPSSRIRKISGYAFDEVDKLVAGLKAKGIRPVDFGVGDPTVPTPEFIRNAGKEAIEKRKSSGYPSYAGSFEFRNAIAHWFRKRFNVNLDANAEVASTIGSKEAIFNFPEAFVEKGDYVIIPNPGYPPYQRGAEFAEGTPYFVNLIAENNFLPVLSEIPRYIAKKSKIIWVNYPNSPSGKTATKEFYKELIDFGQDNEIIIASDEAYSELYFEAPPPSLLEFSKENVIVFNSLSKRSAMTGWRIGWVAGDENTISAFKKLKTNIDSGTPAFIQDAAIAAYGDEKHVEMMRDEYRQKRDILCKAFAYIGFDDCTPEATIYLWQKIPKSTTSVEFAKKLLTSETAIVSTPGEWISQTVNDTNPGKNYVRFALVPSFEDVEKAAERIRGIEF